MRRWTASFLSGWLVLSSPGLPATRAFAESAARAAAPVGWRGPAGPTPVALSVIATPGLWTGLGWRAGDPVQTAAFLSSMERTGLSPEQLARSPDPQRAVAAALSARAAELSAAKLPADPAALALVVAELKELKTLSAALPKKQALALLDAHEAGVKSLWRRRVESAIGKVSKLRSSWEDGRGGAEGIDAASRWLKPELDAGDAFGSVLGAQAKALKAARASPDMGRLESVTAKPALDFRLGRIERRRLGLAAAADPLAFVLQDSVPDGRDARMLEALQAYVPGLDPSRTIARSGVWDNYSLDGSRAAGWALHWGGKNAVSLPADHGIESFKTGGAKRREQLHRIHTAIHEGFHQGDEDYARTINALALLLGDLGSAERLSLMLLEGYTELRARRTMMKLIADGKEGRSPFARSVYELAARDFGPGLDSIAAGLELRYKSHPYTPFVELANAVIEEVGVAPLDQLIAKGRAAGLAKALGPARLRALGELAGIHLWIEKQGATEAEVQGVGRRAGKASLFGVLERAMKDAASGEVGSEQAVFIGERLRGLVGFLLAKVDAAAAAKRLRVLDGFLAALRMKQLLSPRLKLDEALAELEASASPGPRSLPAGAERKRALNAALGVAGALLFGLIGLIEQGWSISLAGGAAAFALVVLLQGQLLLDYAFYFPSRFARLLDRLPSRS